jgi:hypothetical protein
MARHQSIEAGGPSAEQSPRTLDALHRPSDRGWITTRQVMVIVGSKSLAGAYAWLARRRRQIPRRADGRVSLIDVQRELTRKRVHRMAAASLANLKRKTA